MTTEICEKNSVVIPIGFYHALADTADINKLTEILKKVKSLERMKSIYEELKTQSKQILKAQIAVICTIIKHNDFIKGQHLSIQETAIAEYFSEFSSEKIDELIEMYSATTPNALYNRIKNNECESIRQEEIKKEYIRIKSTTDEFLECKQAAINELKLEIKEELEIEVEKELRTELTDDIINLLLGVKSDSGKVGKNAESIKHEIIENVLVAVNNKKAMQVITDKKIDFNNFLNSIKAKIDEVMKYSGRVCIDKILNEVGRDIPIFGNAKNLNFFKQNVREYIRNKYDVVRIIGGANKGDYILLECATNAQIEADLRDKIERVIYDLLAIKKRTKYISISEYLKYSDTLHKTIIETALNIPDDESINKEEQQ